MIKKGYFLSVQGNDIVDEKKNPLILKGINLGGWLMMEGYILGGRNIPEHKFKRKFIKRWGKASLEEFENLFYINFIKEDDFKIIKNLGFNCVRIPFNYRIVEDGSKFRYLKKVVNWSRKYDLLAILDMHSAPGAQNQDWHSDSSGVALLWRKKNYQKKFIEFWEKIASVFREEEAVAGYDILNEPVCEDLDVLFKIYKDVVSVIRKIDRKHIIFLEGNRWAQDIDFLGSPWEDNLVYSIHFYAPLEFTFGFVRNLKYPGKIQGKHFSKDNLKRLLNRYYQIKERYQVPIYVGEFGQQSRCSYCGKEFLWLKDTLEIFKEFGFSWTYWTYKAIAGGMYPDGLFQYLDNPSWVAREKLIFGWETYFSLWEKYKRNIVDSWQTKNFKINPSLAKVLFDGIKI
ncbi:MAG: glycoside hydrolase family 5 protein [Candidatus Omnitrophica bacterium]|nr:glycoside hydrolase family 5 protein [Candidatus Omnitrophota bacterium]